jgi:hypothetical protein
MKRLIILLLVLLLVLGVLATVAAADNINGVRTCDSVDYIIDIYIYEDIYVEPLTPSCRLDINWNLTHHWYRCPVHPTNTLLNVIMCRFGAPTGIMPHTWYHPYPGSRARCSLFACNVIGPMSAPIYQ